MIAKFCFTCGGHGFPDKECPECHRKPNDLNLAQIIGTPAHTKLVKAIADNEIPPEYQGIMWNKESMLDSHPEFAEDIKFRRFVDQLDKLHSIFGNKRIPSKSAIIIAPPTYGKETFAFSCMQLALAAGLTTAKLLDTLELKRLLVLSGENPKYRLYQSEKCRGIDYDTYMSADVLFVSVTKTNYKTEAGKVIMEVLDRRSRLGLPTFFISRYKLKDLTWSNDYEELHSIIDYDDTRNSLKYPVIVSFNGRNFDDNI